MPANKKVTDETKGAIEILFRNGIPSRLIAKHFKLDEMTVLKHRPEELGGGAANDQAAATEKKLRLLKLYAWLVADANECVAATGTPALLGMKSLLFDYLGLRDWEKIIDGALMFRNMDMRNIFTADVSKGYRSLIERLYPLPSRNKSPRQYLYEMLKHMHANKIPFPQDMMEKSYRKCIQALLETSLAPKAKEIRFFDATFVAYLDDVILRKTNPQQREFIMAAYGLPGMTKSKEEWIENNGISVESFDTTKNAGLHRMSIYLHGPSIYLPQKNMSDYLRLLAKMDKIQNESVQAPDDPKDEKTRLSEIRLEDLDLQVREFNCLKSAKINSLLDLVQSTKEELMKIRNFGQSSLTRVEHVLDERGLSFGMTFI